MLVLQALVLASSVQMTHHALGNTPAIITPPIVSPANSNELGATPMQVGVLLHCHEAHASISNSARIT